MVFACCLAGFIGMPVVFLAHAGAPSVTEAFAEAIDDARAGSTEKWIEIESSDSGKRFYVLFNADTKKRKRTSVPLHLRTDYAATKHHPATLIETLDLDCWQSQTTLRALSGYDENGKLLFSKAVKNEQPKLVLDFYDSPLRVVCSSEYLIPLIDDGLGRYRKVLEEMRGAVKREIPDRVVPSMNTASPAIAE